MSVGHHFETNGSCTLRIGKPIFIQCGCWEELCSPFTGAKPQPNAVRCFLFSLHLPCEVAEANFQQFQWVFLQSLVDFQSESTKNRNRKSPRFSVANVPVASQTAMGTFFARKNRKSLRNRCVNPSQSKNRNVFLGFLLHHHHHHHHHHFCFHQQPLSWEP